MNVMMNPGKKIALTGEDIAFLRRLVIGWNTSESGAPGVNLVETFGPEAEDGDCSIGIARWMGISALGPNGTFTAAQQQKLKLRQSEIIDAFEIMLQLGELKPGSYKLANRLRDMYPKGSFIIDANSDDRFVFPQTNQIEFNMTDNHLKLLRRVNSVGLFVDPKRPYGDMKYFEIDMADILGITVPRSAEGHVNFTDEQLSIFRKLHIEMLYAMQVFLLYASLKAGFYGHNGFRCWHQLSSINAKI
jgi:hypothetical protein